MILLVLNQTFLVDKKQSTNVYGQDGKDESIVNVPFGMMRS